MVLLRAGSVRLPLLRKLNLGTTVWIVLQVPASCTDKVQRGGSAVCSSRWLHCQSPHTTTSAGCKQHGCPGTPCSVALSGNEIVTCAELVRLLTRLATPCFALKALCVPLLLGSSVPRFRLRLHIFEFVSVVDKPCHTVHGRAEVSIHPHQVLLRHVWAHVLPSFQCACGQRQHMLVWLSILTVRRKNFVRNDVPMFDVLKHINVCPCLPIDEQERDIIPRIIEPDHKQTVAAIKRKFLGCQGDFVNILSRHYSHVAIVIPRDYGLIAPGPQKSAPVQPVRDLDLLQEINQLWN
mmetsp:Transcript_45917/g.77211  ORF Transcript_45917/g.77211 Transcript_45917/m.77211 type:complete len:294 (-) Transcript_45917:542-1423(-)